LETPLTREPLSNLDAKLRERMRSELTHLQCEFGLTTVYVTHDQTEALALAHEIAVMNDGRVIQIAGAVTELVGSRCVVRSAIGELRACAGDGLRNDTSVFVSVLPEDVELSEAEPGRA
jgi:iron(III) transport system ATP-binding protein